MAKISSILRKCWSFFYIANLKFFKNFMDKKDSKPNSIKALIAKENTHTLTEYHLTF